MSIVYQAWDTFFSDLETGDIILMQGLFESSIFTETITSSHWSHAAVVAISNDLGLTNLPSGTVLLWESNIMNDNGKNSNPNHLTVTDVILGTAKDGPILDRLKERITNNHELRYDKDVAKRKLNFKRSQEMFDCFKSVISDVHDDKFPSIPLGEMSHYIEGKLVNVAVTDNTFFCSQLVAHTYKAFGLLATDWVDNSYSPANFAEGKSDSALLNGASLGSEIRLDLSTIPTYPGF